MNKNYTYPGIELWDDETWKDADAPIHPIVKKLTVAGFEKLHDTYETGAFAGRTDGYRNAKSNMYIFSDVTAPFEAMGQEVHITSMGFTAWIAFIPEHHSAKTPILLIFHNANLKNPYWAMETIKYYESTAKKAAAEEFVLHIIVQDGTFAAGIYMDILLELSALWRLDMSGVYLDVSLLDEKPEGTFSFNGIPCVDAAEKWIAPIAHQYICSNLNKHNPEFDREALVHSALGREMAKGMRWEKEYRRWDDPGLLAEFADKGLLLEGHICEGERWLSVVPANAFADGPLPLFVCTKEVRPSSEFQSLTAFQFYSHFIDIAAQGHFMILFFAMESADDNELLTDILEDAHNLYGYDRSRVYITGQSHNGYIALEMVRRHPETFAGIATLNDRHGIASPNFTMDTIPVSDEMIESFAAYDIPLINICGAIENVFPHTERGSKDFEVQVDAFHRRLKAFRCPDKSDDEIIAALDSSDKANRINGVPGDISETTFSMGFEVYISDILNKEGKRHLRFVTLENLPHMISPQMAELSWSFLKRFKRNPKTGEIVELY
ncbi:MAG: hypothetical protein ACOX75_04970 [Lachnospiraceae bacterium]|jgi:hypothetical protein